MFVRSSAMQEAQEERRKGEWKPQPSGLRVRAVARVRTQSTPSLSWEFNAKWARGDMKTHNNSPLDAHLGIIVKPDHDLRSLKAMSEIFLMLFVCLSNSPVASS